MPVWKALAISGRSCCGSLRRVLKTSRPHGLPEGKAGNLSVCAPRVFRPGHRPAPAARVQQVRAGQDPRPAPAPCPRRALACLCAWTWHSAGQCPARAGEMWCVSGPARRGASSGAGPTAPRSCQGSPPRPVRPADGKTRRSRRLASPNPPSLRPAVSFPWSRQTAPPARARPGWWSWGAAGRGTAAGGRHPSPPRRSGRSARR